ncbi:MAG: hypothetical protein GXX96_20005 [Planctomycetaceae bacterium]|nr:hypothetical protein [Planctomycetaceae bacterium]
MIQPILLQAFATTPVHVAASRQTSASGPCAVCGQSGCDCSTRVSGASAAQPVDELELSDEALAIANQSEAGGPQASSGTGEAEPTDSASRSDSDATQAGEERDRQVRGERSAEGEQADEAGSTDDLTEEEQQQVTELKDRDREVRAHEQAHLSAAGPYATGGPSYEYQEGPDGRRYAIGGEVGIDTSPVSGDPEATIEKAQQVRTAALAPASPSSQDQRIAAAATQMEAQARVELATQSQASQSVATSYGQTEGGSLLGALLDLVA